jgi:hypothetical protein
MTRDPDLIGLIEGYLDDFEGHTPLPDAARDAIRARLPSTPQRPAWWPGWRSQTMNTTTKYALGAAAAVLVAVLGTQLLTPSGPIGGPVGGSFEAGLSVTGSRCIPASAGLVSTIAMRLTAERDDGTPVPGGVSLRYAYIVESRDGDDMYFVGAKIERAGMENIGAVWLTNDPSGAGSIFAVDDRARQFSDWPDRAELEPTADGFSQAEYCARLPNSADRRTQP